MEREYLKEDERGSGGCSLMCGLVGVDALCVYMCVS